MATCSELCGQIWAQAEAPHYVVEPQPLYFRTDHRLYARRWNLKLRYTRGAQRSHTHRALRVERDPKTGRSSTLRSSSTLRTSSILEP